MRILHVNDPASVAGVLAKYQNILGHSTKVVARNGYDHMKQQKFYGDTLVGSTKRFSIPLLRLMQRTCSVGYFYFYVAITSRHFDVVHIHSSYLVSLFLPFKPKIIEFHGSEIRRCPSRRWWIDRQVTDLFLRFNRKKNFYVSTSDLVNEVKPLRILHVFDCASVGECMAKHQRVLGHNVDVAKFGADYDGSGMDAYYGTTQIFRPDGTTFYQKAKKLLPKNHVVRKTLYKIWHFYPMVQFYFYVICHSKGYDVLHIHTLWPILFFTPFKSKVIEYHGDDIRALPTFHNKFNRFVTKRFVNIISKHIKTLVSTNDLVDEVDNAVWIPNPVDIELFSTDKYCPEPGTALYSHNWYETGEHAKLYAEKHNLKLTVLERKDNVWINYEDFPYYMGKFEYYIDRVEIKSLSKSALEFLAMGGKVVDWKGEILEGLPACHNPMNVAKATIKIYEEVLKKNV